MFSRKTCVFLNFSSYNQVYTARCTTYNQGMPNSNISFYLYQIVIYFYGTILNSFYIQAFFCSHLLKSLFCVFPEQLDIVQFSVKVLHWGQFSSQPFHMSFMYGAQDHSMWRFHFTISFILLISLL